MAPQTVHALVDLVHDWASATDSSDTMVRAILLDFRKAFDLISHRILIEKLANLRLPGFIVSWVSAFLQGRKQRVRVGQHVTQWIPVRAGVPQGTRLGPILFLVMINSSLESHRRIKYVDDTVSWDVCHASGRNSQIQTILDSASTWSLNNMMQLNASKTKEMVISFSQKYHPRDLPAVALEGKDLERVTSAKILGVIISSDLSWDYHVDYVCSKANQRLYFMCLLRRAGATSKDMVKFYKSTIRSAIEYASPVWHTGLTADQSDRIEAIQRRALKMIEPALAYEEALTHTGMETLHARRESLAKSFFQKAMVPSHKLHHLCRQTRETGYDLRRAKQFQVPALRTKRAQKTSLINYGLLKWQ